MSHLGVVVGALLVSSGRRSHSGVGGPVVGDVLLLLLLLSRSLVEMEGVTDTVAAPAPRGGSDEELSFMSAAAVVGATTSQYI